jgi:hypothetical protein
MNFKSCIINIWVTIIILKNIYYILLYVYDYVPDYTNCGTNVNLDSCIVFVKRTPIYVPDYSNCGANDSIDSCIVFVKQHTVVPSDKYKKIES